MGKTTLTLGIIASLRKQGKTVAPFKKGPDFIDAGWLGAAAARFCRNLDLFMMEEESITRSFLDHAAGADVAVIEGNRGLYDGVDESGTYSTARLARLLDAPVVLIVDCTKSSATVAAVVLGIQTYDPLVAIRGVILNNVAAGRQETVIRKAIELSSGIPVVGAVPRLRRGEFPERHMGLTPFHEHPDVDHAIAASASVAEQYLDLDALWKTAADSAPILTVPSADAAKVETDHPVIGVIRDKAFQFYYQENIEALEQSGAVIRELNALTDQELPEIDALYIGGGFPETQAAELAANRSFCRSIKAAADAGLPVYAECGGLIYLGRSLRIGDVVHSMASVFPSDFVMETRPQAHGYTVLETSADNSFFEKAVTLRGHEFHYSRILNPNELPAVAFNMKRGAGIDGLHDGLVYKNVLASYTHLHALGAPEWVAGMMRNARNYRMLREKGAH